MEGLEIEVLKRLVEKALKELDEAYRRIPDVNNGKTYLWRGRERIRLMAKILNDTEG
ncbi:hypothetical protein ADU37_CDS05130 [Thermococcus sp. 2319x1]|uniref:hypothetical protein n=1 Tax=Thermococcus sp. 2319x1 TaxID=1674923 RepID=UPI00073ADB31|nr:hypothetical protein [Thermococcus sp. 2319x1]ALV62212.1 hypothetical protein ADU37_CDS05130 [Thermococcus sp. 2319x1]